MAARGYVPKDVVGAAGAAAKIVKGMLDRGEAARGAVAAPAGTPFYAGCALPQDHEAHALTHKVARDLGLPLAEAGEAGCCGHPTRGQAAAKFASDEPVVTACPACDQGLREIGARPPRRSGRFWWSTPRRNGRTLRAAQPDFVPYVGCLSERGPALSSLGAAAAARRRRHADELPVASRRLLRRSRRHVPRRDRSGRQADRFRPEQERAHRHACLLCRDNVRSAVRKHGGTTPVYFWPEFFQAAGPAEPSQGDDHD